MGRPWLATVGAYIGCQTRNMKIHQGIAIKSFTIYPHAKPSIKLGDPIWFSDSYEEWKLLPTLMIEKSLTFKQKIEDANISSFITQPSMV